MTKGDLDLSGEWTGIFNYPVSEPSVAFEATIHDSSGTISGTTTEVARTAVSPAQRLDAVIDGRREGRSVQFIKMYDQTDDEYDVVQYSGSLDPEGDEIAGTWQVAGMSGTFLMVRRSRAGTAARREAGERIDG
ncbi:MAG TPA: hypothetical protein VFO69_06300 [Allosphingosinicella sp.]|nr:hypothetical protein [Allosphingosinicella sp.]